VTALGGGGAGASSGQQWLGTGRGSSAHDEKLLNRSNSAPCAVQERERERKRRFNF
jgi:hypothetical protein